MYKSSLYLFSLLFAVLLINNLSCKKLDIKNVTKVKAIGEATEIDAFSAKVQGQFIDIGKPVSAYGHCWSTNENPTVNEAKYEQTGDVFAESIYTSNITGLSPNTNYFVKAYAIVDDKIVYSNSLITFSTINNPSISITSPNNLTEWAIETEQTITWSDNIDENVNIALIKGGSEVLTIAASTKSDGSYTWQIPALTGGTNYSIKISSVSNSIINDQSDDFSITTSSDGLPSVSNGVVTDISDKEALIYCEITNNGGNPITKHGICWNTNQAPTVSDFKTEYVGEPVGSTYKDTLKNLKPNTTYYVRAYATNNKGTSYGNEESFTTLHSIVTDYNGNKYRTVEINGQIWMAENFRGTAGVNGEISSYIYYDYAPTSDVCITYGRLYTWEEAMKGAPEGWHLPTDEEWMQLEIFLGMNSADASTIGWRGDTQGDKLKEQGTEHWNSPSTGSDDYGFTALPGGKRESNGNYEELNMSCLFWSSTEINSTEAWCRQLILSRSDISRDSPLKDMGLSVRYIKNTSK